MITNDLSDFMILLLLYYMTYHHKTFKLYRKTLKVLFCFLSLQCLSFIPREREHQLPNMTTGEEKAFAVLEFHSDQSVITVERHFRTMFEKDAP